MQIEEWLGADNTLGIDIWNKKYRQNGESFDEWLERVSGGSASIKRLIIEKKFLFGGRILSNRGMPDKGQKVTYSNCYVVPAPEDSIESIFESASKMARTFSYGGGVGIDLSKLAPRGARVNNTAKFTTGAVSFTDLYSFTTGLIGQNQRRGATMLSISCEHPDAEEFMRAKMDVNRNTSANMSIRMTDDFMRAVEGRKMFDQIFKREVTGEIIKKEIDASKFFDELCYANWDYGEPGCLYWDRIENWNLLSEFPDFHYAGVNPCVTGDTLVLTTEGYIQIKDLVGKEDIYVYCMDDNGNLAIRKALKIWKTRENASLVKIITHRGILRCTPDHLIHTQNKGWVPASELKHGDKLTGLNRQMRGESHIAVGLSGGKYIAEHRLIAGAFYDIDGKDVHHIDNDPFNNKLSNLAVLSHSEHSALSNTGRKIDPLRDEKGRYVEKPQKSKRKTYNQGIRTGVNWFVKSVEFLDETEDVYDMTVEEHHNFIANNIVIHNCAEEPLPAGGSCLLGSLNLSEFVIGKSFDFHGFQIAVQRAVVALNEVLDEGLPLHPLQEQRDSVKDWRQIGLGIMGLADMLIKLGIRYGSEEAIVLCDRIGSCMINSALAQSARLAWEHGAFPKCNNKLLLQSKFLQENATKEVIETIRKYGLRNSQLLTIAPTGTLSTMLGISGGIEPIFATHYDRTTKMEGTDKVYRVYTPCVKEYMDKYKVDSVDELPEEFVTAQNLDWKSRVDMQAIWQKHIDASISSTVNLPENFPQEDVKGIYMSAWKSGCKGITVFRDGCKRLGILTTKTGEKAEDKTKSIPVDSESVQTLEDIPDEELVGKKRKIMTGCGNLHITAFFDKKSGMLKEIFLSKGSTGGCLNFMNGLSRMISLSARKGIPFNEIIDQLKSSGACSAYAVRSATHHDTSKGSCCPMAVGNALIEMRDEFLFKDLGLKTIIPSQNKVIPKKEIEMKSKPINYPCPNCGTELQFSGGCNQCPSCGYSKCS